MTDFKNKSRVDFQKHLEFLLVSEAKFTISWQKKSKPFSDKVTDAVITFRVSRRPREMYCGHARLCVSLCVCLRPHAHTIARTRM